jgi:hypothetical protein
MIDRTEMPDMATHNDGDGAPSRRLQAIGYVLAVRSEHQ